MYLRGRDRASDEAELRETVAHPFAPYWATGRFYGATGEIAAPGTATNVLVVGRAIFVPRAINIVSIGCEVSGAGGAGTQQRLALYTHDAEAGVPGLRVIDSGALVADATGFQSATVNIPVTAGW